MKAENNSHSLHEVWWIGWLIRLIIHVGDWAALPTQNQTCNNSNRYKIIKKMLYILLTTRDTQNHWCCMLFYHTRLPTCNYYASTEMLLCKYFCSLVLQERGFRILFLISDLANLYHLSVSLNMAHNMISCLCFFSFFFFFLTSPLTYRLF